MPATFPPTATGITELTGDVTASGSGSVTATIPNGTVTQAKIATGNKIVGFGTSFPGSPATDDLFFRTDWGGLYYYSGTNWKSMSASRRHALRLRKASATQNQSLSATPVQIYFDTVDENVGGTLSTVSNQYDRWTPGKVGVYLLSVSGTFTSVDSGQRPYFSFRTNGSEFCHQQGGYSNVASGVLNIIMCVPITVTSTSTYIEVWAGFNTGTGTFEYAGGGNFNVFQAYSIHTEE